MTFITGLMFGFLIGVAITGLLLAIRLNGIRHSYRSRLAAAWVRQHNQDVYIAELQQRLDRAPALVWMDGGPAVDEESGPTSGIEFYLN